jgi:TolB-like protein/lipoprotein NlpI
MSDFLQRLKRRKLVQWAVAYAAFAFASIQVLDVIAQRFGWPSLLEKLLILALAVGFLVALVLAWYHGERGAQKVSSTEIAILALLLAIGGGLLWQFERTPSIARNPDVAAASASSWLRVASAAINASPVPIPAKSIAVLPFENLSTDKGNAYFADGMQDLILTKLADIGQLKVISRTSTMKYASHPDDLKTIARQLGVATILEGSVQKAGNQVLINVQLIDASSDNHLWAESYTRTLDNVFGVEGEVAGQIAKALKAKLSPAETQRLATGLSNDPAANDLFLRAEYLFNQGIMNFDRALMKQAVLLYRQAIAKAPDFALARARLAFDESLLVFGAGAGEDVQQLKADARAQAEQALALAPDLVDAQLAAGYCDYYIRGDYAGALTIFDAVLKTHPNNVEALTVTGYLLTRLGRVEAAIAMLQQAFAHDPRSSTTASALGLEYLGASRYSEAKAAYQHALALDPNNFNARLRYSQSILLASGDVTAALAAVPEGDDSRVRWRIQLLTYQRKYQDALALLAGIPDTPANFGPGGKALAQANLHRQAADVAHAKPLFEQALPLFRARLTAQAGNDMSDANVWTNIADAELGLGHIAAGLAAIVRAQALVARTNDHINSANAAPAFASLYAEAGRPDLAVPLLEKALAMPGIGSFYSPVMLWIDPAWDPIRQDPRFQALLKKYAKYQPASANAIAPGAFHPARPVPATTNGAAHG